MTRLEGIPVLDEDSVPFEDFRAVYDSVQCVCFRPKRTHGSQQAQPREPFVRNNETEHGNHGPAKRKAHPGRKRDIHEAGEEWVTPSWPRLSRFEKVILHTIRQAYDSATPLDQESWNVESDGCKSDSVVTLPPSKFLSPDQSSSSSRNIGVPRKATGLRSHEKNDDHSDGYCSFVLQDNSNGTVSSFTKAMERLVMKEGSVSTTISSNRDKLPHSFLTTSHNEETTVTREQKECSSSPPAVAPHWWIFVGRHHPRHGPWRSGRKEHTDAIEHDGTVHHQLVGSKLWKLRPTHELQNICNRTLGDRYEILVRPGDVLVINTRLWWHQTAIPPGWSVSCARDIFLDDPSTARKDRSTPRRWDFETDFPEECCSGDGPSKAGTERTNDAIPRDKVGNVEVSWASGFIPRGMTLIIDDDFHCDDHDRRNEEDDEDDRVASCYHHLVPSTIGRTRLESKANCKLVVIPSTVSDPEGNGDGIGSNDASNDTRAEDASSREPSSKPVGRKQQIALEAIRDIHEGEEFVMLFRSRQR